MTTKNACPAVTIWPEIAPHGARLACSLPAGHGGDHACADIEYLSGEAPS